jgi:hypothetical protein
MFSIKRAYQWVCERFLKCHGVKHVGCNYFLVFCFCMGFDERIVDEWSNRQGDWHWWRGGWGCMWMSVQPHNCVERWEQVRGIAINCKPVLLRPMRLSVAAQKIKRSRGNVIFHSGWEGRKTSGKEHGVSEQFRLINVFHDKQPRAISV